MRMIPFVLVAALATPALAAPARVAVLDLNSATSPELGRTLAELVAFELEGTGRFQVLTRDALASRLQLKGLQQGLGCDSEQCEGDVAKAAEVDEMVSGSVLRAGSRYVLLLRRRNAGTLAVIAQVKQLVPANEDALVDVIAKVTGQLAAEPVVAKKPSGEAKPDEVAIGAPPKTESGGLGMSGTGLGGGGSGEGTIGLGSIGTIGHGSGSGTGMGYGRGGGARATRPPPDPAITPDQELRLRLRLEARLKMMRARRAKP